ncbi:MAG: FAD-binding oxidoreductase [Patescibacteria group bacterium]|nr:FAD-binding oxidoreductase [Patescibacteria group bacterium]
MNYRTKILYTEFVTHDVKSFIVAKPDNFSFIPGQATRMAIARKGLEKELRPFTFTSRNNDLILQFIIKRYPEHKGITDKLHQLKSGDEIIVSDPRGTIHYEDEGVFIAGGAGITPFIAILRDLKDKNKIVGNKLIFSNKTAKDIILEKEFKDMFYSRPGDLILTLTDEKDERYENGRVDELFLKRKLSDFNQHFYICGPPPMVEALKKILKKLGAKVDNIVFEK